MAVLDVVRKVEPVLDLKASPLEAWHIHSPWRQGWQLDKMVIGVYEIFHYSGLLLGLVPGVFRCGLRVAAIGYCVDRGQLEQDILLAGGGSAQTCRHVHFLPASNIGQDQMVALIRHWYVSIWTSSLTLGLFLLGSNLHLCLLDQADLLIYVVIDGESLIEVVGGHSCLNRLQTALVAHGVR